MNGRKQAERMGARLVLAASVPLMMLLGADAAAAQEPPTPSVQEVVNHLDDLYRADASHATVRMTVVRDRGTRELELEMWSQGDEDALAVIRSPAREAGTATLRTEEGLWNYAPRADRLIRVPTGLLSESWMGSHFTNDDLMRETSYLDDYDAGIAWASDAGERRLRVTLTPKPDAPVVYTRIDFLLAPEDWIPVRTEYYDEGERVRTMRFSDVQLVDGRRIPLRMELRPADGGDERTVMQYVQLSLDAAVDEALFTRRGLRRVARRS